MKRPAKNISVIALVIAGAAMLSYPSQAGEVAEDAQQKCLELTRIAADSMRLTPADEEWCRTYGRAIEIHNAGRPTNSTDHGTPSKLSRAEINALVARFINQNPEYANEPLAAKIIYAISAMASGEMR